MARWVAGPHFRPTDPGPSPQPTWQRFTFVGLQVGVPLLAGVLVYVWVFRPWRRTGRLTTDAMIAIAASTVFFWDMSMNYTSISLLYNSHLLNRGAWANGSWPGWTSPSGSNLPEPLLIVPPAYTALVFSQVVMVLAVVRCIHRRRPNLGVMRTAGLIVVGLTVSDTVIEGLVLRTGVYAYPGAIRSITLFAGRTYQIPLSETVLFGGCALGAIACLSYFRDDAGRTVVERGIDRVGGSRKRRQVLRFFAIYGFVHLAFLLLYFVPQQWFATHEGAFPGGYPSYLLNHMCTAGVTGTSCPGPHVPMPRP